MDEHILVSANPFEGAVKLQAKIWQRLRAERGEKDVWVTVDKGQIFYACPSKATHLQNAKLAKMVA